MERELTKEEKEHYMPWSFKRHPKKLNHKFYGLPRIQGAVWEHGIPAKNGEQFIIIFESANSDMGQGVNLISDNILIVGSKQYKKGITIFFSPEIPVKLEARPRNLYNSSIHDSKSGKYLITCYTKEGVLWVWNVWEYYSSGVRMIRSHDMFSGMLVEELPNGYRYQCNEGLDDDDYDDLIFRIERTGIIEPPLTIPEIERINVKLDDKIKNTYSDKISKINRSFGDNHLIIHYVEKYVHDPKNLFYSARLYAVEDKFNVHPSKRRVLRSINMERDEEYITYCYKLLKKEPFNEIAYRAIIGCDAEPTFKALETLGYKLIFLQPNHKTEWGKYYARIKKDNSHYEDIIHITNAWYGRQKLYLIDSAKSIEILGLSSQDGWPSLKVKLKDVIGVFKGCEGIQNYECWFTDVPDSIKKKYPFIDNTGKSTGSGEKAEFPEQHEYELLASSFQGDIEEIKQSVPSR